MKILSLKTKTNMVIWGVVIGLVIHNVIAYINLSEVYNCTNPETCKSILKIYWPIPIFVLNLLFWSLVGFGILSAYKFFTNKDKTKPKEKVVEKIIPFE